jgi:hypothetical protein
MLPAIGTRAPPVPDKTGATRILEERTDGKEGRILDFGVSISDLKQARYAGFEGFVHAMVNPAPYGG